MKLCLFFLGLTLELDAERNAQGLGVLRAFAYLCLLGPGVVMLLNSSAVPFV